MASEWHFGHRIKGTMSSFAFLLPCENQLRIKPRMSNLTLALMLNRVEGLFLSVAGGAQFASTYGLSTVNLILSFQK